MIVNWGDIYEAIYMCNARTVMADAFRKAVGLPLKQKSEGVLVYNRKSAYAGVDFEKLMEQRHGVRL